VSASIGAPSLTPKRLAENVVEEFWFGDDDPIRSHLHASSSLAAAAALATGLKPFPVIAQRVLSMTRDPTTSATELCRVIERDPGLLSKVLRVANSAIYAPSRPCTNIEMATMRLGMKNVGQIVFMLVAHGMFSDTDATGAQIREHCVGVSVLVRRLAMGVMSVAADDLFLAGLLHDVGKLLAIQTKELDYSKIEAQAGGFPEHTYMTERKLVGWDHAVLGAHVIENWQLPRNIALMVAWHHQPARAFAQDSSFAQAVALLRLADRIDYQFRVARQWSERFLDDLERASAFEYTNYDATLLRAAWPDLVATIEEGQAVLGSGKTAR
jgi:putative nucleotidyltransferase with HDIG domain